MCWGLGRSTFLFTDGKVIALSPLRDLQALSPLRNLQWLFFCCCCCFDHLLVQLRGNVTAATCSSGMVVVHGQRAEDSFGGFFSFDEDAARYYNPSCFGVIICIVVHCNSSFTSFFFFNINCLE